MISRRFYRAYIEGTPKAEKIVVERGALSSIKPSLKLIITNKISLYGIDRTVYISTKSLKHIHDRHIYDKKSEADFFIILDNLANIIRYPDRLFLDLPNKRGDFIFVKKINKQLYLASVEITETGEIELVSASATGENYLEKFTVLWSWGNG